MADDLVEQCSKLYISSSEDDVVDLDTGFDDSQDEKLSLCLVGRIFTNKSLNFNVVKRTLIHVWSLKEGVIIRSMGFNLFLF